MRNSSALVATALLMALGSQSATATGVGVMTFTSSARLSVTGVNFFDPDNQDAGWNATFSSLSTFAYVDRNGDQRSTNQSDVQNGYLYGFPNQSLISILDGVQSFSNVVNINQYLPPMYSSSQCGLAPAVGQVCSIISGAFQHFNFVNTEIGTDANVGFQGIYNDYIGPANFRGNIEIQFPGLSFQEILRDVNFNAVFVGQATGNVIFGIEAGATPVPEPASIFEVCAAGFLLAVAKRKSDHSRLRPRR